MIGGNINRKTLKKRKENKKNSRKKINMFFYFFIVAIFFGVLVYTILWSSFMRVDEISFSGINKISYDEMNDFFREDLSKKIWKIFPKNNFIFLSQNIVEKDLKEKFKRIRSVEVEKKFPNTVSVKIDERMGLIIWCSGGPCYIVDDKGYAYAGANDDSPEIKENQDHLIKIIDASGQPVSIGEMILSEDYIKNILELKSKIESSLGVVLSEELYTPLGISGDLKNKTSDGWIIYFSTNISPEKTFKSLEAFLSKEMKDKNILELEYVDLRIENKIYYKFLEKDTGDNKDEDGKDENSTDGDKD